LRRRQSNGDRHTLEIPGYIIGEPEHTVSARFKPLVAAFVVADALFEIVTFAIDLDDKPA
jgi:hypothetical protein